VRVLYSAGAIRVCQDLFTAAITDFIFTGRSCGDLDVDSFTALPCSEGRYLMY